MWPFSELKRLRSERNRLLGVVKELTRNILHLRQENKELHGRLLDAQNRLRAAPAPKESLGREQITKERFVQQHLLRDLQQQAQHAEFGELREINGDAMKFADSMNGIIHPTKPGES